jgi:putative phosphoesterase
MRIAIISDVHGNLTALEAVVADLKQQSPDTVIHLGDLAANGARPAEVVDKIAAAGWRGVYGNTDEMLWRPELLDELAARFPKRQELRKVLIGEIGPHIAQLLGAKRIGWLRSLPLTMAIGDVFFCHASPADPWVSPREESPDEEFESAFAGTGPIAVFGHIHFPLVRRLANRTVVNTGALSLSYDQDWRASYVIIDGKNITHRRVEYDIDAEVNTLMQSRVPRKEWLASILRSGRYCDPF